MYGSSVLGVCNIRQIRFIRERTCFAQRKSKNVLSYFMRCCKMWIFFYTFLSVLLNSWCCVWICKTYLWIVLLMVHADILQLQFPICKYFISKQYHYQSARTLFTTPWLHGSRIPACIYTIHHKARFFAINNAILCHHRMMKIPSLTFSAPPPPNTSQCAMSRFSLLRRGAQFYVFDIARKSFLYASIRCVDVVTHPFLARTHFAFPGFEQPPTNLPCRPHFRLYAAFDLAQPFHSNETHIYQRIYLYVERILFCAQAKSCLACQRHSQSLESKCDLDCLPPAPKCFSAFR